MAQNTIETGTPEVIATAEDGVALITMNRPERYNALSQTMLAGLEVAITAAERNPEVNCVVLTGGGGAFCSGGDMKAAVEAQGTGRGPMSFDDRIANSRLNARNTSGKLYKMTKPTIASLPGPAAGAGFSLALACDLRIAADSAIMTTAFAKVGFSGDYGGTYFLPHLVGAAKARELYFLSDRIDMKEALRLGLVNWVVPADQLMTQTMELAHKLARAPKIAYRYIKENLNRAASASVEECLDLEITHHSHCGTTEDHREAARAFVEKRPPSFKGR